MEKIKLLARERKEDDSQEFFYRFLMVKNSQRQVCLIKDEHGKSLIDLDKMAKIMLDHLSQIIGQEEEILCEIRVVQDQMFAYIKWGVLDLEFRFLERLMFEDEFKHALFAMGP